MKCLKCGFKAPKFKDPKNVVSFHKLPKANNKKQLWIEMLALGDVPENSMICSLHFSKSDFRMKYGRRHLVPEAVPCCKIVSPIPQTPQDSVSSPTCLDEREIIINNLKDENTRLKNKISLLQKEKQAMQRKLGRWEKRMKDLQDKVRRSNG